MNFDDTESEEDEPQPQEPVAPPAPIPKTDAKNEARGERQRAAGRASQSGYESTMLTERGGDKSSAQVLSPVLGG